MITTLLAKIFGNKNERAMRRIRPIVTRINELERGVVSLEDHQIAEKTNQLRERVAKGESLDSILPEAFALVREATKRTINERHYDVQMMGGIILHGGNIAEMRTGEGKTLVATLPLYLNSLSGKGAHLVTVNDYLVKRDAEWMTPAYNMLGCDVGIIQHGLTDAERQKAYGAHITYGTNNELGFDYLRDNMKFNLEDYVQRDLNFAIVDEADSILIDEGRTPHIISGAADGGSNLYILADRAVSGLQKDQDYEIDEKRRDVYLTESGVDKVEAAFGIQNLYASENLLALHHAQQALKAHATFKRDVDYVVHEGEVLIVDEFTGRILAGRRYSDGLHQALEAKEKVKIERENQTLATITLQNYFRMYTKIAGMTGTADTEELEFHKIYKLGVTVVPTHRPIARIDEPDAIYLNRDDKFNAVIDDILLCHAKGQPVLVGTVSIEVSEYLSHLLNQRGIQHNVLNAKQHEREAEIIKTAGELGHITIATNMAGRGTDIKLGKGVREVGGLRIIGTERHEARRIDNQLRGRAGRQGDPGSTKFYLSLDDDLIRVFAGDKIKKTMEWIGMEPGECIEDATVTNSITGAQERVEKQNFDIRKTLIEYDDVMNHQRNVIYQYRREILEGAEASKELVKELIVDVVYDIVEVINPARSWGQPEVSELYDRLAHLMGVDRNVLEKQQFESRTSDGIEKEIIDYLWYSYDLQSGQADPEMLQLAQKWLLLETVDFAWKIHLQNLDHLKEGINLRSYGQKNPLIEYKNEAFAEFKNMMQQIKWDIVNGVFKMRPAEASVEELAKIEEKRKKELTTITMTKENPDETSADDSVTVKRIEPKTGRNDVCPCGSGKKFKQCCGR